MGEKEAARRWCRRKDDVGANYVSKDEYKKGRGELSKMRALLFYQKQKRHHRNKIKSKKYRTIRKKKRLRAKEGEDADAIGEDGDLARGMGEKAELDRMEERISLKHTNISKWAKRVRFSLGGFGLSSGPLVMMNLFWKTRRGCG